MMRRGGEIIIDFADRLNGSDCDDFAIINWPGITGAPLHLALPRVHASRY